MLEQPVHGNAFGDINLSPRDQVNVGRHAVNQRNLKSHKKATLNSARVEFRGASQDSSAHARSQTQGAQVSQEQMRRQAAMDALSTFYDGTPRGSDAPAGQTTASKLNETKKTILVYTGKNLLQVDTCELDNCNKLKYGIQNSQNPSLQIQTPEHAFQALQYHQSDPKKSVYIHREHMTYFKAGSSDKVLFRRATLEAANSSEADLFRVLTSELSLNIAPSALRELKDTIDASFGTNKDLELLSIRLAGKAILYSNCKLARKLNDYTSNGQVQMVFIRDLSRCCLPLDRFWDEQMTKCFQKPYPFYEAHLDQSKKLKYVDLHNRIMKEQYVLPFPEHLAPIPQPDTAATIATAQGPGAGTQTQEVSEVLAHTGKPATVVSCKALNVYTSLADMRHKSSIGLVRDSANTLKETIALYCHNKPHVAKVMSITANNLVIVGVTVNGFSGGYEAPQPSEYMMVKMWHGNSEQGGSFDAAAASATSIPVDPVAATPNPVGTTASINNALPHRPKTSENETSPSADDMDVDIGQPTEGTEEDDDSEPEWRASIQKIETLNDPSHFVIAIDVGAARVSEFVVGNSYEITIRSLTSALSTNRHLHAVSWAARNIAEGNRDFEIQQFLMGVSNKSSDRPLFLQCKTELHRNLVRQYYKELGLNEQQQNAILRVFQGDETGIVIQGPPGTGKSVTNSAIGVMCGLSKFNCLLSAPTNLATEALMAKMISQYNQIRGTRWGQVSNVGDIFNLIYFRSIVTTRVMLFGPPDAHNRNYKYEHASYIEKVIQYDQGDITQAPTTTAQEDAREWMNLRARVIAGQPVPADQVDFYLRVINDAAPRVFKYKSFVVVSTCNTAAQLKDWRVSVKVVTVDEVAFALEADFWIAASLSPDRIVLTGENEQLSPHVTSMGVNEQYEQIKLDAYTRLDRAHKVMSRGTEKTVYYDVVTHLDANVFSLLDRGSNI